MARFCPECGIKLDQDYKFCPDCGYSLQSQTSGKSQAKKNSGGNVSAFRNNPREAALAESAKGLSTGKIIGIFGGITGFLLLIMFLAGVFDTPKIKTVQNQPTQNQNQSSGVDLSRMQEIQEMQNQLNADPGNMKLTLQLAHLKNDAGLPDQAIPLYRKYLEINPSDADARVDMGVCYYVLKNYPSALSEMKEALKYKPDHQIAHLNLGIVNFAAGNTAESKEWLQKAVDLNPTTDIGKRAQELLHNH